MFSNDNVEDRLGSTYANGIVNTAIWGLLCQLPIQLHDKPFPFSSLRIHKLNATNITRDCVSQGQTSILLLNNTQLRFNP